jgi:phosphate acetyltransferase
VALVRESRVEALMKGSLHTDELMGAVVARESGIRTERRISHCFIMDVPGYVAPLIITDAAVNIAPSLEDKVDIVQNAIDLAQLMGIAEPRVAVLSAMETVNPSLTLVAKSKAVRQATWSVAKRERRVLATGMPAHHAATRTRLTATAVRTCCRRVLARPT